MAGLDEGIHCLLVVEYPPCIAPPRTFTSRLIVVSVIRSPWIVEKGLPDNEPPNPFFHKVIPHILAIHLDILKTDMLECQVSSIINMAKSETFLY